MKFISIQMKSVYKIKYLSTVLICLATHFTYSQSLPADKIYKKVSDAVVVIHTYDDNNILIKQGSGVVLKAKGLIVTNYHVIDGGARIEIVHKNTVSSDLTIVGLDKAKDILMLQMNTKKFTNIKIGNSDQVEVGHKVYAIGSPLGLENTISDGIVSGLRVLNSSEKKYIQITASISPGSSGGAVVNDKGELIGISTLTFSEGQNLNFAIPINDILNTQLGKYSIDDLKNEYLISFNKGENASANGNYKEAVNYYSIHISKYPNDAGAYYNRGNAKAKLGDLKGSIVDYNSVLEISPNFDYYLIKVKSNVLGVHYNRGLAKCKLEDYRGAIMDFTSAIEIKPRNANAYHLRGISKHFLRDIKGACDDMRMASELGIEEAFQYLSEFCY